jgi:O-antigen/teichoic acid export membrane protein
VTSAWKLLQGFHVRGPMSTETRTVKSARNMIVGLTTQAILVLLGFASRGVFVTELGVGLVGVNSLLLSILAVLGVTDLGLNGALIFALYKPLSVGDSDRVSALVRFCASMYRYIALAVALIGLALLPFLGRLVSLDIKREELYAYYLVLLINSVGGYLMAYRAILLQADQRAYVASLYSFAFNATRYVVQIAALLVLRSYLLFLIIQVVFTLLNNLAIFRHAGKRYPYLRGNRTKLDGTERRIIFASVRAMFIYRIGDMILNNTDAILISAIVGTAALGYYSNYTLIVGAILMFTDLLFNSLTASVGSMVVASNETQRRDVLNELVLFAWWIFGFLTIAFLVLSSEFIGLWIGGQFVVGQVVVTGIALNFLMNGMSAPIVAFRQSTGLFRQTRYVLLVTAALNVGLSVVLGRHFGVAGIVFATAISRLLTNYWYEPLILHRRYLGGGASKYFAKQIVVMGLVACSSLGLANAMSHLPVGGWFLAMKAVAVLVVVNALFLCFTWRTPEFRRIRRRLSLVFDTLFSREPTR